MGADILAYMNQNRLLIDQALYEHLKHLEVPERLKESMLFSIEAGGKRLRPILLIASYQAFGNDGNEKVLSTACALEMVHTYSLIHDDLPAMDNDDFRRGKPTNHRKFNEATAILAGDALLTYSFEIITNDPNISDKQKAELVKMLSRTSGPKGMIAGQMLDMAAEDKKVPLYALERIHALKTGELLKFAVAAGALIGNATRVQIAHLHDFADFLGLLFQVQDDILDVAGDPEKIGKPVGSDETNNKSTYPGLLGMDGAVERKKEYAEKAKDALQKADADTSHLMALTDYFSQRDY